MNSRLRLALLIPLATLLGCSASPPSTDIPLSLTGNWQTSATTISRYVGGFVGALQSSGGSVSGTLTPQMPPSLNGLVQYPCATMAPTAVTGSIDANNNLTLSLPLGGGTATITATIGSNPETVSPGSFQIAGGTCATPATSMTITEYAPVTGTYTGSLTNMVNGTAGAVTAVLTQSTIANSNGVFPLTGTVTLTGQCSTSFVINSSYSYVEGNLVEALAGAPNINSPVLSLWGYTDSAASTISLVTLTGDQYPCDLFEGTLNLQ